MRSALFGFIGAGALLAALPAASHHSFAAEFDINRPVKLTGAVTKLEWTNPHAWVFVDAADASGKTQSWAVELVGINDLLRRGWGRDRVKEGDVINVQLRRVATNLDVVQVTALGQGAAQRSLGTAQQLVSGEEVAQTQRLNFVNALQGRVAGVEVLSTSVGSLEKFGYVVEVCTTAPAVVVSHMLTPW